MRASTLCSIALSAACAGTSPSRALQASGGGSVSPCAAAHVFFAPNETRLDALARHRLDVYAECLSRREIDTLYVAGESHTGANADTRQALDRTRALAIAEYLRAQGCDVAFVIRAGGERGALASAPLWPP